MSGQQIPIKEIKKGKGCCFWMLIIFVSIFLMLCVVGYLLPKDKSTPEENKKCEKGAYVDATFFSSLLKPDYSLTESEEKELDERLEQLIKQGIPPGMEADTVDGEAIKRNQNTLNDLKEKLGVKSVQEENPEKADSEVDKINGVKNLMASLKDNYPEGYFLIATHILKTEIKKEPFVMFLEDDTYSSASVTVHELSHGGIIAIKNKHPWWKCYWIEDKHLCIPGMQGMPEGKEAFSLIENKTLFDTIYLKDNNQNIYTTLDEVIAYTKSARVSRAFQCFNPKGLPSSGLHDFESYADVNNLARQVYTFSMQLKNIKENHPKLWAEFSKKQSFAFVSSRVIEMAKKELELYQENASLIEEDIKLFNDNFGNLNNLDSALSGENESFQKNLELINNNSSYLSDLLKNSRTLEIKDRDLDEKELKKMDIIVEYLH